MDKKTKTLCLRASVFSIIVYYLIVHIYLRQFPHEVCVENQLLERGRVDTDFRY